jgi:hypothetical protein
VADRLELWRNACTTTQSPVLHRLHIAATQARTQGECILQLVRPPRCPNPGRQLEPSHPHSFTLSLSLTWHFQQPASRHVSQRTHESRRPGGALRVEGRPAAVDGELELANAAGHGDIGGARALARGRGYRDVGGAAAGVQRQRDVEFGPAPLYHADLRCRALNLPSAGGQGTDARQRSARQTT